MGRLVDDCGNRLHRPLFGYCERGRNPAARCIGWRHGSHQSEERTGQITMDSRQIAAINTARYSVLLETFIVVYEGVEMKVREGFRVDGLCVLLGLLTVG